MEIAELVVAVRGKGIDETKKALSDLRAESAIVSGEFDTQDETLQKYANTLRGITKTVGTFTQAEKLLGQENKRIEQELREQRRLTWTTAETLYKLQQAEEKRTQEATRNELERTWRTAKYVSDGRVAAEKKVTKELEKEAAAQRRVAMRPASTALGRVFGGVSSKDGIRAMAEQVDMFRSKMFDFLVVFGTLKAAQAIIVNNIIAPLKAAVNAGIEFERQWAIITRTVTGSREELAVVRSAIRDLMANRPFDPQEITDAARALGELGVQTKEIGRATDYITRFSVASGIATEEAATMLGQILGTSGVVRPAADDLGELGSAALDMGTKFAIGNKGVLTSLLRVSALIPTYHLAEDAALGLATAMGSLGIKPERGTSALQLLFSMARNADPTKLERFANIIGQTTENTKGLIDTNIGRFTELFVHGLDEINKVGGNTDAILGELGIKTVRARQAFGQLAGGADTVSAAMREAEETYGSTNELIRQSDEQMKTTDSQMKTLSNSVWALAGSLTEGLLTPLKDAISGLHELSEAARKASEDTSSPSYVSMLMGGFSPGNVANDVNAGLDRLKQLRDEEARRDVLGGSSPLAITPEMAATAKGVLTDIEALASTWESMQNDTLPPFLDPKRLNDVALSEQADAAKKAEKDRKRLFADAAAMRKKSLTDEEEYTAKINQYAQMRAAGAISEDEQKRFGVVALNEYNEARQRAIKTAEKYGDTEKATNREIAEAAAALERVRTPQEKYNAEIEKWNDLKAKGVIVGEQYNRLVKGSADALQKAADKEAAAEERARKALERKAAAGQKLTPIEREILKITKDAMSPQERYAALVERVNVAVENGLDPAIARIYLEKKWVETMKEEDRLEGGPKRRKAADDLRKYAVSLNPVVELEEQLLKIRQAAAKHPDIVTPDIAAEAVAKLKRDVALPEAWERQMRIVEGITERSMNAIADTMTDALWDGAQNGKEIMRSFAKDITNILAEEIVFKPVSESILNAFRGFQVDKYIQVVDSRRPEMVGPPAPGTDQMTDDVKTMTRATTEYGDGVAQTLDLLSVGTKGFLDSLGSGLAGFFTALLGIGGGGNFSAGGLFLNMFIGGATSALSKYGASLLPGEAVTDVYGTKFSNGPTYSGSSGPLPVRAGLQMSAPSPNSAAGTRASVNGAGHGAAMTYVTPVEIHVTSLDPKDATAVIMANMPVIERGMQRAADRGSAYAKAHGRRR